MNGGEHNENPCLPQAGRTSLIRDVRNGFLVDPRRSGAVYSDFIEEYNGIDAASEVSWSVVLRPRSGEGLHSMHNEKIKRGIHNRFS